jgi:3-methyladenine DNA glycosylase/8-oxoguanine DNA glycosylase
MQFISERKPQVLNARDAVAKLAKTDARLATVIANSPPFELKIAHMQNTFEALAESIVYQQLTGKAAACIFNRLKIVTGEDKFPTPEEILALPEETIRAVGLSRAKTAAIIDLARRTKEGLVPDVETLHSMTDEEIIQCLTAIRGIGPWSVEMLLIFRLGRLDVIPATDYGVRKGFTLTYKLDELPTPKQLLAHAEKWRPYRTIGSWYMWRALEFEHGRTIAQRKKVEKIASKKVAGKSKK